MLYLAIALPICILLLHYFPPSITFHKILTVPQEQTTEPGGAKETIILEQATAPTMDNLFKAVNETFHEIGEDDDH